MEKKEFKVGDPVVLVGTVVKNNCIKYPSSLVTDNGHVFSFTDDGKFFHSDTKQSVFHLSDLIEMQKEKEKEKEQSQKPKYGGEIAHFPEWVVELMLQRQVEQGNERRVSVFEKYITADIEEGGFRWHETPEDCIIWSEAIDNNNYVPLAQFHNVDPVTGQKLTSSEQPIQPSQPKEKPYPKWMMVGEDKDDMDKRYVLTKLNGCYIAMSYADTPEEVEKKLSEYEEFKCTPWIYAEDIDESADLKKELESLRKREQEILAELAKVEEKK